MAPGPFRADAPERVPMRLPGMTGGKSDKIVVDSRFCRSYKSICAAPASSGIVTIESTVLRHTVTTLKV